MTFIRGQNCELRAWEDADNEPFTKAVNAGLTTQHLFTGSVPMRTADYASRFQKMQENGDILFGIWAVGALIVNTKTGEVLGQNGTHLIGQCGLHDHRDIYKSWEARFLIFDADAVGKGIGKEVVRMLTSYAFQRLNAHRVWLGVSEANIRAVKCYLDCGYQLEGRLRDEIFYNGKYHAALRMAVLENEWTVPFSVTAE
jgi:RimJ/RimL family protein N-acetyltransferase